MTDSVQQSDYPQWKLLVSNGANIQETCFITHDTVTIGRELDNGISLDDMKISRYHARLVQQQEALFLEDLNSVNGTLVNGEPVNTSIRLNAGDAITLGSFTLKVQASSRRSREKTESGMSTVPEAHGVGRTRPLLLVAVAILLLIVLALSCVVIGQQFFMKESEPVSGNALKDAAALPSGPAIVINQAPSENNESRVNRSVTVQAIASDPSGIKRMELWVNGRQVDYADSPLAQSATSMTAVFQWTADVAGEYTLEIRAFNEAGQMAVARVVTLSVVDNADADTPAAQPSTVTPTVPAPPLPTPAFVPEPAPTLAPFTPVAAASTATPALAMLTVKIPLLNVRTGPGTDYTQTGMLKQGEAVEIVGQTTRNFELWWKINLTSAPTSTGWVIGSPEYVTVENSQAVPITSVPLPPTATPTATSTLVPSSTPTVPLATVIVAPAGKTLLIVSNRSIANQPARLTLSGGKSVGGGKEIDPPPNGQVELVLEPDFYRALWSAPWNNFTRGADFTAVPGKVMSMWIVPEQGVTMTEIQDELVIGPAPMSTPTTPPSTPLPGELVAPPGKALFVVSNRSVFNEYALLTISGGSFGGGKEIILDANTEFQLELLPGDYRTIWNTPAGGGMNAGREFSTQAGEVIYGWIIPEKRETFMQFPGQPVIQINN